MKNENPFCATLQHPSPPRSSWLWVKHVLCCTDGLLGFSDLRELGRKEIYLHLLQIFVSHCLQLLASQLPCCLSLACSLQATSFAAARPDWTVMPLWLLAGVWCCCLHMLTPPVSVCCIPLVFTCFVFLCKYSSAMWKLIQCYDRE